MRVVDTSAWIEWLIDSATGAKVEPALPERDEWLVPTIVQLELAKWLTREAGEEQADEAIAFSRKCVVVDLDTRLALAAAEASAQHKLSMADAIVYATAQANDADVLTTDDHFKGLPGVTYVPKTRP